MKYLVFFSLWMFIAGVAFAQVPSQDQPHTPPTFQLYLDGSVQSIEKVHYNDEQRTPVRFQLSKDRQTLYLLDYHKRGSVSIEGTNLQGQAVEIRRSSCYIDPVMPS